MRAKLRFIEYLKTQDINPYDGEDSGNEDDDNLGNMLKLITRQMEK